MSTLTDKISWHESQLEKQKSRRLWHESQIELIKCRTEYHEAEIERLKAINDKL